ncbi:MAG TPA: mismatch-specific DNA-glycosylase [Oscillatoriaceae cyanobacterium]
MAERIRLDGVETLADILADDLDLLFVGYNPNPYAVAHGHYYARKANRFWEDLHEAGFVPRVLREPGSDVEILEHGLGLTDLIKRPTPNIDGLSRDEFERGILRLDEILARHRPRIVCFNGLGLLERYARLGNPPPGTLVRVVPSTSPRNNGQRAKRLEAFREIKALLDRLHTAP